MAATKQQPGDSTPNDNAFVVQKQGKGVLLLKSAITICRPILPMIIAVLAFEFIGSEFLGEIANNAVRMSYWFLFYLYSDYQVRKPFYESSEGKLDAVILKGIRSASVVGAGMSAYYVFEDYVD